jgi:hypothetical protein
MSHESRIFSSHTAQRHWRSLSLSLAPQTDIREAEKRGIKWVPKHNLIYQFHLTPHQQRILL